MILEGLSAWAVLFVAPATAAPVASAPEPIADVWLALADCESGQTWDEGDGGLGPFRGGLQFHPDTWAAFAPPGWPADPAAATPAQEVAVAERVLAAQGWGAWPVCARKLGLIGAHDG